MPDGAPPGLGLDILHLGDCREVMVTLPSESVDLVITDPPFAIDFQATRSNYNRRADRVLAGYAEVGGDDYSAFTHAWVQAVTRLLKPSGSMYIFSGWNHLKDILIALDSCGLTTVNHLIWKYQFGVVTRRKYVTSHYHVLYVCKDDKVRRFYPFARFTQAERTPSGGSAHYQDKEDVWTIAREYWPGARKTPTKLPAALIEKILAYSSVPGDVVLDPFVGSGQVAVVSHRHQRRYVGIECVPAYFEFAQERLQTGQYHLVSPAA